MRVSSSKLHRRAPLVSCLRHKMHLLQCLVGKMMHSKCSVDPSRKLLHRLSSRLCPACFIAHSSSKYQGAYWVLQHQRGCVSSHHSTIETKVWTLSSAFSAAKFPRTFRNPSVSIRLQGRPSEWAHHSCRRELPSPIQALPDGGLTMTMICPAHTPTSGHASHHSG